MLSFCYQFQNKSPENRIITQFSGLCLSFPLDLGEVNQDVFS